MSILVIDYGMGNLASVKRAFEECGADVIISDDPKSVSRASKIVLPGVGSFAMAMNNIRASGWFDSIKSSVEKGMPMLGICLGMQLLADEGEEHGSTKGLGLIAGKIQHFSTRQKKDELRVPHVGWNEISDKKDDVLLNGIDNGTDFYFVHSYYFNAGSDNHVLARTPYGDDFASIVRKDNVWGTQFHPEKSSISGFQLIRNFLSVH